MNTRLTTRTTTRTTTRAVRSTAVAGVALAAVLGLSACGDGGSTVASGDSGASSEIAADAAYNAQDVTFVKDMKPHHEQAVDMADMVLAKDPGPEIKALAEKIKAAQEPEIAQLDAMLAEFDVEAGDSGGGHGGGHGGGSSTGGSSMTGMMSDEDMQALEDATGTEAERIFLEGMLAHHKGAVEMATREIDGGKYPQAIELAETIKADQQAEITQMEQLLSKA